MNIEDQFGNHNLLGWRITTSSERTYHSHPHACSSASPSYRAIRGIRPASHSIPPTVIGMSLGIVCRRTLMPRPPPQPLPALPAWLAIPHEQSLVPRSGIGEIASANPAARPPSLDSIRNQHGSPSWPASLLIS